MKTLTDALRSADHVFLDFDGPVCSVFAGLRAPTVAARLRDVLAEVLGYPLPDDWAKEDDPLALLRRVDDTRPELTAVTDSALADLELDAVALAEATEGGESTIHACQASGRAVWIVSNNASVAIHAYLSRRGLTDAVAGVFGRVPAEPALMKPHPRLLHDAMHAAAADPASCIFVGDAARDVLAGEAAGVDTIGYANKPGKKDVLQDAGAVAVVESMKAIADALFPPGVPHGPPEAE
ncbi:MULTISPECIES: HAD family hydrolase [unclassified Streptomyces]|uniref:HAD family hydrolase n=1 Tax=unclassified Streptomyces TaxID=2593676 RepID=UPI000DAED326|nr:MULTISPECIES: HAD-IA family hydrolase [unclassified Streptomyces]PZT75135.1 haloacid dehalogenase [Streptomyces sp. AC1-42T]PZT81882.1 haloacid dehalogenase [Streptomyces sp. AC1-42W]